MPPNTEQLSAQGHLGQLGPSGGQLLPLPQGKQPGGQWLGQQPGGQVTLPPPPGGHGQPPPPLPLQGG